MANTTADMRSAIGALADHNPDAFYLLRDFVEGATASLDGFMRRLEALEQEGERRA